MNNGASPNPNNPNLINMSNSDAGGPNNNGGSSLQGGNGNGGSGATEYTLQGIMRFLQMEWHNHERARNAWEIEREELKQKAARDEGLLNKLRRQVEALEKHVKMLEGALKAERARSKAGAGGGAASGSEEAKMKSGSGGKAREKMLKQHNSFLDTEPASLELEKDAQLERSRKYLNKCIEEITYLLLPPSHPPPPRMEQQQALSYAHEPHGMTMEDVFRQKSQQQQQVNAGFLQHHAPNHGPPPAPSAPDMMQPLQATEMMREPSGQHPMTLLSSQFNPSTNAQSHFGPANPQDLDRSMSESFEQYGHAVSKDDEPLIPSTRGDDPPLDHAIVACRAYLRFRGTATTGEDDTPHDVEVAAEGELNLEDMRVGLRERGRGVVLFLATPSRHTCRA